MVATVNHDESSRFDFVESVRRFNYRRLVGPLVEDFARRSLAAGTEAVSKDDVEQLYVTDPAYLFACAMQRGAQQIAWSTAFDSVNRRREELAAQITASKASHAYSRLELDPGLELPKWYTSHTRRGLDDIHLVPGGYWADELVGAVYDLGGAVYRLAWRDGYDARPGALDRFASGAPSGSYGQVLDLGCSFGGLTRTLRRVFPDAEVTGIDVSAPALCYAHLVAEHGGQRITYAQRDATTTGFADDSFDLVAAFLLLHEVPDAVREQLLTEAYRILRPGGHVMFLDIPPYRALSPEKAFFESFDGRANGENFWEEFLVSDLPETLRKTGFIDVREGPLDFVEENYWGSSALWRTGSFDPVHRWVTRADKPTLNS